MTKIKNYALDLEVRGDDKWIGTDSGSLAKLTKNFTPDNLAKYYNDKEVVESVNQLRFFYDTVAPGEDRARGSFSFPTEVGAEVPFSSISNLVFSRFTLGDDAVNNFMTDIVNSIIILQKADNPDIYAFYALNGYEVDPTDSNFYNVELSYESGNGSVQEDQDYFVSLIQFAGAAGIQTILGSEFIDSTLTGVGEVTLSLSATGTADDTTYLRGDNTWAAIPEPTGDSDFVYFTVKNETGVTINKGKGVMAVGTDGNSGHILIDEMIADGTVEAKFFLGVLETSVDNGEFARVISFGQLSQFDTRGQNGEDWNDSDILWCDPANPGDFTIVEPDGPNVKIAAAFILNSSTNGKIQIRVQANEGVHDLHDTRIVSQQDGDVLVWNDTDGVWFNDSTLNVDYTNARIGIGTTSPTQKLHVEGTILVNNEVQFVDSSMRIFRSSNDMRLRVGGSDRMTINSTGNVGIGTTSPSQRLEVDGDALINNSGDGKLYLGSTSDYIGNIGSNIYMYSSGQNIFYAGGSEQMRITTVGNVGIGTTTPNYKLVTFKNNNTYNAFFTGGNGTRGVGIGYNNTSPVIQGLAYNSDTTYYNLSLQPSGGNVGIGTTAPSTKLHVIGDTIIEDTSAVLALKSTQVGSTSSIQFESLANAAIIGGGTADYLSFLTASNHRMRILANGNVGIGTTSPTSKLHVVGGTYSTGGFYTPNSATGYFTNSSSTAGMVTTALDDTTFNSGGAETMRLTADGKVGIGTTIPASKLDVKGGIRMADDAATASATNEGTLRYRKDANNSYIDMCMQTGASTYAWVNIKTNTW